MTKKIKREPYLVEMSTRLWPTAVNPDPTPAEMPSVWEAATRQQLEWQIEHGSYMQRIIAKRYLPA